MPKSTQSKCKGEYSTEGFYPEGDVLSSTMLIDYARSPFDFYERWVLGVQSPKTHPMMFGSLFSKAYADRSYDYRSEFLEKDIRPKRLLTLLDDYLPMFPEVPTEYCENPFFVSFMGFRLRITPDAYIPETKTIVENKTGQNVWTQQRADCEVQISLQAWAEMKMSNGKPPKAIIINHLHTGANVANRISTVKTKRSAWFLDRFEKLFISPVVKGIKENNFTQHVI